jgi:hypothetical protein
MEAIKAKCLWLFANVIRITNKNNNVLNHLLDTDYDVINRLSEADSALTHYWNHCHGSDLRYN